MFFWPRSCVYISKVPLLLTSLEMLILMHIKEHLKCWSMRCICIHRWLYWTCLKFVRVDWAENNSSPLQLGKILWRSACAYIYLHVLVLGYKCNDCNIASISKEKIHYLRDNPFFCHRGYNEKIFERFLRSFCRKLTHSYSTWWLLLSSKVVLHGLATWACTLDIKMQ